jgi:hypothetical protein
MFIRDGIVYIPTMANTEAGYYMHNEPVEVVSISDSEAFVEAIKQTIARGHPTVPTPTRATGFPKPVIPQYAKLKSWKAFEKGATSWSFNEKDGIYHIEQWQKRQQGGWLPDPSRLETLPLGTSLDEAVKRLVTRVRDTQTQK